MIPVTRVIHFKALKQLKILSDLFRTQTNEQCKRIHQIKVSSTSLNLITSNTLSSVQQNNNSPIVQAIDSWKCTQSIDQRDNNFGSKIFQKQQNLEKNIKRKDVKNSPSSNESCSTNKVMDIAVKKKPTLINDEQMLIPEDKIWTEPNENNEDSENDLIDKIIIGELEM